MADLFSSLNEDAVRIEPLDAGVTLLHGFALEQATDLFDGINSVIQRAPYRQLTTPGGFVMSVDTTSCGTLGWFSDHEGYRYVARDPATHLPWPAMPQSFLRLASQAASMAGFEHFTPDACLINRYLPGAKMSLHQDKNERDFSQPIVSVSLGLPATFLFGGLERSDPVKHLDLQHGDVLVWGGAARLRFHGVMTIKPSRDSLPDMQRINLTFRLAG